MQFAHSGDYRFAGFFVRAYMERGIFFAEPCQCLTQAIARIAAGGADGHLDNGHGHVDAFQGAILRLAGVGIAAGGVDAHYGYDVAAGGAIDFLAFVGVHLQDTAETLLLAGALVVV